MSVLSKPYFHDEEAAFAHLEGILWPQGPVCPHCGNMGKIYKLEGVRSKASKINPEGVVRHGLRKCAECKKQFTVKVGTVFESGHVPLHKMLQAVYLLTSSKKGISAHQLHRILEVQYKTAWFLAHRIREAMRTGDLSPMGGGGGVVEVDETYIGKASFAAGREPVRGPYHKRAVIGLVERGGSVRTFHAEGARAADVAPVVRENLSREAKMMTDESKIYMKLGDEFSAHFTVNHSAEEYVRYTNIRSFPAGEQFRAHTNTIEGYFSIFKRGMKGIYQHCSEKHLHRYLAEFDFRYNNRVALGVEDGERAERVLGGVLGKRLLYRDSSTI